VLLEGYSTDYIDGPYECTYKQGRTSMMSIINNVVLVLSIINILIFVFALFNFFCAFFCKGRDRVVVIIIGIVATISSIAGYVRLPDKDERVALFMQMKPKCEHETVKCLEAKARWYKDSIEYNIRDTTEIIDSIKHVIDQYKTEK
jgi:hypothetical protein